MSVVKINYQLTVSDQPDPATFRALADRGFAAIVNARPDGEEPDQPGNVSEETAAQSAGLDYAFLPVTAATITEADVRAFRTAIETATGPVLAHCKSGTRALTLYALGEALDGRMKREEVETFGRTHGFDLSGATRWLERWNAQAPRVKGFYDARTGSIQYVVADPSTGACAIIDPVHDFDEKSGATATTLADEILDYVRS